ncbi:aliphatic sulfonate ABC transporter ATP-binding protein [Bordetella sp. J329]|jgi:sulfonate transport system ATP-binding protein|uniref:ATP-binding cassette domain-containing protein n=1 Tax=Kerstersia gyiorum TaxID=206506 RepID=UPI000FD819EA|nr:ATP-binding cassette domain-containing protein [Kerstersia gyiorum]AZV94307.1 aliphatic sulfonate ABC transporter ATP-binding protein [Bordetella sp. J329]MCH4273390.1 ATP-binding cassette domain-containing protein [Kerstersia gyiorum]MCI1230490.1 ATP-binding cassette domain-containing protein [Kerstersia gyiorum]
MSSQPAFFPSFWRRLLPHSASAEPQAEAGAARVPRQPAYDRTAAAAGQGLALSIRGLEKSFGSQAVIRTLDLEVGAGQFLAIVGRSGCGKSTLLRALASLETADGGQLQADGGSLRAQARNIRMMFQDSRLLPWLSVLDNIGLGLRGDWRPRARAALEEVGLTEHAGKWPAQLSGGQRQRVALARALIHRPRLLLLDEPLGALDALTRLEMQALVEKIWQTHAFTVLLVTHEVEEAVALGDRVVLMDGGQVALDLAVPLPRPRARGNPAFVALRETVLDRVLQKT